MVAVEDSVEARIARLESDVGHIQSDISEIKTDIRGLRDRVDEANVRLPERIDALRASLEARLDRSEHSSGTRFDAIDRRLDLLSESIATTRIWMMTLFLSFSGVMLATMARGFGWI